jgi:hypothetical protein
MYDVIVAGGGFSGVAAACSAAREGLSVLLIEKHGFLGGAACGCYVNPFMRYHLTLNGENIMISDGLFRNILTRLDEKNAMMKNRRGFNEELLKLVFDEMTEEYGITVLFHSYIISSRVENSFVKSVTVANKLGCTDFEAHYFIDATGDADLSVLSGCNYRLGREADNLCQPMTLCFRIAGVDYDKLTPEVWKNANNLYSKYRDEGKIKNPREDILHFPHVAEGVIHLNSTRIIKKNPVDTFDVSEAERMARKQEYELYSFLKENVPGFENSVLLASAPEIGVRESRMIEGEYTLTENDLKNCTKFDDAIAAGNYDIDIHNPEGSGTSHYFFKDNEYYTIPFRCLQPKGIKNLLTSGRCISSTHEAQASYRIMPICCTLGEAAGTAIGVCAAQNVPCSEADVGLIRQKLISYGAFLGQNN